MIARSRPGILLLPLLLVASACGEAGDGGTDDGMLAELPTEEVFRVGTIEGSGWEAFADLRSVAFDANGRLYILDTGQTHVVVLEPDGTFVRTIGTRGEGPEELRSPRAMTVLGSGEVAVYDIGHQAFLVYSPEGEFRRSIGAGFEDGIPGLTLWPHGSTGVVSVSQNVIVMTSGGGPQEPSTTAPIRRYDLAGEGDIEVVHEAWIPPRPEAGAAVSIGSGVRMNPRAMRAFEPQVHLAALPDGRVVVADSSSYRMRILSPDGEELDVLTRDVPPQPVGEAERRAEQQRRLAQLEEGGGPQISIQSAGGAAPAVDQGAIADMFRSQIEEMEFWHEIPVISEIAVDARGRIWIVRSGGVDEPGPIDILSPEGDHLATLPAEAGPIPDAFGPDGLAAWIETDELDVPYVRVRRVTGIPEP